MRLCCRKRLAKRILLCGSTLTSLLLLLLPTLLPAKIDQHTAEGREDEMEDLVRTSSYIPGLCYYKIYSSTKYSRGGYSSTTPWLRWHLYCYPPAAGVLWGIGFLAIWDQKVGIGTPFIGAYPSTYSPVEPAGSW